MIYGYRLEIIIKKVHVRDTNNNCIPFYRNGTLEEKIGRKAILELCNVILQKYPRSELNNINFDVADISRLANENDAASLECITIIGTYLGKGIASINHILDISNFVIGGGISQSELLIKVASDTARQHSLPSISTVNIVRAKFLNNTGIVGAALFGKNL